MRIKTENGSYNRFEILDKRDVLEKLLKASNRIIHVNASEYHRICDEISLTAKATAKLFFYDNKHDVVCAFSIKAFDDLYDFLDSELPIKVQSHHKINFKKTLH